MKEITKILKDKKVTTDMLKKSFMDACSDKKFKEYVCSLGIKEDILIKYTTKLEESFRECQNCENCRGLIHCQNKVLGYRYTPLKREKTIDFNYSACKYELEKERLNSYQEYLYLFEMPDEIKRASLKEIYLDDKKRVPIIKFFKDFLKNYSKDPNQKGLYLYGNFGSGKTYLIAALFNEMAHRKVQSATVYFPELLRSLKASFKENYDEQFNKIKKAPLLLLDDIGAENMTSWARDEILGPILQYRMQEKLPTFFTSNLDLEQLEKHLSVTTSGVDKVKARRIIERIKQLTISQDLISSNRRD